MKVLQVATTVAAADVTILAGFTPKKSAGETRTVRIRQLDDLMIFFHLETAIWVAELPARVFPFFAEPANLERLTPPWLQFEILTGPPVAMAAGARIDYRLRLHGVALKWQSEITRWEPPERFVDEQRRGPYRLWVHAHTFTAHDGGTCVGDEVDYVTPGGALVNRLLVAPDLRRVFRFRHRQLAEVFGDASKPSGIRITRRRA